jgi:hypothetical protein
MHCMCLFCKVEILSQSNAPPEGGGREAKQGGCVASLQHAVEKKVCNLKKSFHKDFLFFI